MDITNPQRAKVLVHALPYIQEYSGKIVVIKYGGNAMISDKLKDSVMRDIVLLSLIGGNMLREGLSKETSEERNSSFSFKTMLVLAVATSIDALAVGITFALLPDVNLPAAVSFIGATTFILSAVGLKVGNVFGLKYKSRAEIAGGIILILLGVKILLEHLGVL